MKRILLLGGYGGFGSRLARRLADAGYEVLVAGRNAARAEQFCKGDPRMRPVRLDRSEGLGDVLEREGPWAVVDASGPFQSQDYRVPSAAIAAGCHYLDIADARDFVCGIGGLDGEAKAAGVCAIAGASSDPALVGAVARKLGEGISKISAIDMALSVSSRTAAGQSVARAALSYAGRPLRLCRGGRWTERHGWHELRRKTYRVANRPALRRTVALVDVPSLELLPARLPGQPAVNFRAGAESALDTYALRSLAWLIRRCRLRSLEPLHPILKPIHTLRANFDRGRSALEIRLFGVAGERRLERRWTIIAENDAGREIPCLAVPLLLARIAEGTIEPGARDADGLLTLDDFEPDLAAPGLAHEVREFALSEPLYAQIMTADFAALPPAVRAMHRPLRDGGASGRATVTRGENWMARAIGAVMGFPAAGEHDLHVHFEQDEGRERWTRSFSGRTFHSAFSRRGALIVERFGAIRFGFALECRGGQLHMRMRRWWIGPLPLPLSLAPQSPAREWEEDGRFHFDVPISLPLVGEVIHYRGWLMPC